MIFGAVFHQENTAVHHAIFGTSDFETNLKDEIPLPNICGPTPDMMIRPKW
jgi:hypothetical protein